MASFDKVYIVSEPPTLVITSFCTFIFYLSLVCLQNFKLNNFSFKDSAIFCLLFLYLLLRFFFFFFYSRWFSETIWGKFWRTTVFWVWGNYFSPWKKLKFHSSDMNSYFELELDYFSISGRNKCNFLCCYNNRTLYRWRKILSFMHLKKFCLYLLQLFV